MTGVLVKRGTWETHRYTGRMPCDGKGRDRGDASTGQRTAEIARKPAEARREAQNSLPHSLQKDPNSAWEGRVREGFLEEVTELNCKN